MSVPLNRHPVSITPCRAVSVHDESMRVTSLRVSACSGEDALLLIKSHMPFLVSGLSNVVKDGAIGNKQWFVVLLCVYIMSFLSLLIIRQPLLVAFLNSCRLCLHGWCRFECCQFCIFPLVFVLHIMFAVRCFCEYFRVNLHKYNCEDCNPQRLIRLLRAI